MIAVLNVNRGADLAGGLSQFCELLKVHHKFLYSDGFIYLFLKYIKVHTAGRLFSV